jgi:hypothetical protein
MNKDTSQGHINNFLRQFPLICYYITPLVALPESSGGRIRTFPLAISLHHCSYTTWGMNIVPLVAAFQRRSLTKLTWSQSLCILALKECLKYRFSAWMTWMDRPNCSAKACNGQSRHICSYIRWSYVGNLMCPTGMWVGINFIILTMFQIRTV